ncbi:NADH dehydrogenase subunit C [Melioribacter roseus P3M-2]|jgi:NADH-quinone oxidoreductase subunit C|uniref:NADH-quinone oxidoreductase subunit C n=1 Tax=Melioribacter roseus (strain DSM 23840 / JCM 17771 / VKM B-2668 / P3M-2) TaxID=1191523 RepID=I6YYG9_MELRP|nr:NADH-quinone oxidoreductase subunit C [Melioribacter roseus]AFN75607.1 NADH dehydrogenase subunit C [Melioribacter roseus P3M-2]
MKNPEEIFDVLKNQFGDDILGIEKEQPTEPIISVTPSSVDKVCLFLRDNEELKFDSLMNLSGVDDANGEKVKDEDGGEIIKGGTLSVYYHLYSIEHKHKITLKTSTPREEPRVESVESVWKTANWHEREAYDMLGIIFNNHPDLRRILMPYDWDAGYPLRKDYKNPEFYQGMKVPY